MDTLQDMKYTDRIELVARRALDDREGARKALAWYPNARAWAGELARAYPLPVPTSHIVGAIAALSPQQSWEEQTTYTPAVLRAFCEGLPLPGPGFRANKAKALRILKGEEPLDVLSGDKVRAFYRAIMGETDAVVIDRHAWAIATGPGGAEQWMTEKRYRETAEAYRAAAAALRVAFPGLAESLTPSGVQALTWCWWRENEGARF